MCTTIFDCKQLYPNADKDLIIRSVRPSAKQTNPGLNGDCFRKPVSFALGRVTNCYAADVDETRKIEQYGLSTVTTTDKNRQGEEM